MAQIILDIETCLECPYLNSEKSKADEKLKDTRDYYCFKMTPRKFIAGCIYEREMPKVPEWCPIIIKK